MSSPEPQEPGDDFFGGVTTTAVVNYCASPPPQTRPIGDGVITKVACSRLSDSGEDAKESWRGSFLLFHFRVCAFSIQRTRLSRSLEQAITKGVDFLFSFQRGVRNLVCSLRIVKVLKIMKEKRIVAASDK